MFFWFYFVFLVLSRCFCFVGFLELFLVSSSFFGFSSLLKMFPLSVLDQVQVTWLTHKKSASLKTTNKRTTRVSCSDFLRVDSPFFSAIVLFKHQPPPAISPGFLVVFRKKDPWKEWVSDP